MQEFKLDLSNSSSEEELKKALKEFRERNGLGIKEPEYNACRWSVENVTNYINCIQMSNVKPKQAKMFYLPETGSVHQNNVLINAVVFLQNRHFLMEKEIEQILAYSPPLLVLETMVESEPGSCVFVKKTFDLVQTAINCEAKTVLEYLLPYIDFSLYHQDAVLNVLDK